MTEMARLLDPLFTATLRVCLKLVLHRPKCWLGFCQLAAAIDAKYLRLFISTTFTARSLMLHLQNK